MQQINDNKTYLKQNNQTNWNPEKPSNTNNQNKQISNNKSANKQPQEENLNNAPKQHKYNILKR